MTDGERQALYYAASNAVNAFEYGTGDAAQLKHTVQGLVTQLGGTLQVADMSPGQVALYIAALYLRKAAEP